MSLNTDFPLYLGQPDVLPVVVEDPSSDAFNVGYSLCGVETVLVYTGDGFNVFSPV